MVIAAFAARVILGTLYVVKSKRTWDFSGVIGFEDLSTITITGYSYDETQKVSRLAIPSTNVDAGSL